MLIQETVNRVAVIMKSCKASHFPEGHFSVPGLDMFQNTFFEIQLLIAVVIAWMNEPNLKVKGFGGW